MFFYNKQTPDNMKEEEIRKNSYSFVAFHLKGEPNAQEIESHIEHAVKSIRNSQDRQTTYYDFKRYICEHSLIISDKYQTMLDFLLSPWSESDTETIFWERMQKLQHPFKIKRMYFVPCKCLMWLGVVQYGDFQTAAEKIHEHFPDVIIDKYTVKDIKDKIHTYSFIKTLDEWNEDDAPVHGKPFKRYKELAGNLIKGLL